MPAIQNLVLTDNNNTDHTYVPRDIVGGVATVAETSGVPFGNALFSISTSQTAGGAYKVRIRMSKPVLVNETVNGVTKSTVLRTARFEGMFTFDPSSTATERANFVSELKSAFAVEKTLVWGCVVDLQGIYR